MFVIAKCLMFGYKLILMMRRYHLTYKKWNVPENWFIGFTILKIAILLPNYWLREINMILLVFVLNSMCSYWLNYML